MLLVTPPFGHQPQLNYSFAVSYYNTDNCYHVTYTFSIILSTVELQSNDSIVVATTDDASTEMSCEMGAFIRPDSSLIWEGPGGERITPGRTNKHQITFTNGSPDAAVNGSFMLFPSRLCTLIISNPEPSDNGTYTCSVVGTDQAVTIELVVLNNASTTVTPTASTTRLDISVIVGSVTAVLGLLTFAAIALRFLWFVHSRRKEHSNYSYPMYNYPLKISGNNVDQTVVTSGVMVDSMERNKVYVVTDGIEAMEENCEAYGMVTDGIEAVEKNEAYDVITDGIKAMEKNEAYGVVTDGIKAMEENQAYGVVMDGIEAMEKNEAYGVVTHGIDRL